MGVMDHIKTELSKLFLTMSSNNTNLFKFTCGIGFKHWSKEPKMEKRFSILSTVMFKFTYSENGG